MNSLAEIQSFLQKDHYIAIAGASRNKLRFGRIVYDELKNKGFQVVPLNKGVEEIGEEKCYKEISELPDHVKHVLIITNKASAYQLIEEAIANHINDIWLHSSCYSKESHELAKKNKVKLIYKQCPFMYLEPVQDFHKFHKNLNRFFGMHPK